MTGNATQAAIAAGYSFKNARYMASENLAKPCIVARLRELHQKAEDAAVMSVRERKIALSIIARARITDFVTDKGVKVDSAMPSTGAIEGVRTRVKYFKKGIEPVIITELKLRDPIAAIECLNKMDRLYTEGTEVNIENYITEITVLSYEVQSLTERILAGEGTYLLLDWL
jgi:phage terminase small subunit